MIDLAATLEDLIIYTVFDVSITHIPERDRSELQSAVDSTRSREPLAVVAAGDGYQVYCREIEESGRLQAILDFGYTTALTDLLQLGFAKGCHYININRFGRPVYNSLPTYDW